MVWSSVGNVSSTCPEGACQCTGGCYGKGVEIITLPGQSRDAWRDVAKTAAQLAAAPEPQGARPPSERALDAMAAAIRKELLESKGKKQPRIVPLPDDWRTEGNWLGSYGKYWMCLYGADHGPELVWGTGVRGGCIGIFLGPHHWRGDVSRRWMQPPYFTTNPRALQIPPIYCQIDHYLHPHRCPAVGTRAISEVDDHGERYPSVWQGPDLSLLFRIPKGRFTLSLYEWNYNGHTTANRLRDYAVSVQTFPASWHYQRPTWAGEAAVIDAVCYGRPSRMVARAEQDWGGQWVRFMVRGPTIVAVRFRRNHSFNTHVLGAALDYLSEHPAPYYYGFHTWANHLLDGRQRRQLLVAKLAAAPSATVGAGGLIADEELLAYRVPGQWAATESLVYTIALRAMDGRPDANRHFTEAKARAQYRLALFNRWQKTEHHLGLITPRQVEDSLKWNHLNLDYRSFEFEVIRREVKAMVASNDAAHEGAGPR